MMGLEIPQNWGAHLPISVFRLTSESEFKQGFWQSSSKHYLFNLKK